MKTHEKMAEAAVSNVDTEEDKHHKLINMKNKYIKKSEKRDIWKYQNFHYFIYFLHNF